MRVSNSMLFRHGVNAMQQQQAGVAKTQQQIATGKRILSPADDPVGAQRVLDLQQSLGLNQRYQQNADRAAQRLAAEETALEGAMNVLQRVRELAVQANNDTYTAEDRRAIAAEVEQRVEELVALANSRDANGEFLFAGNGEFLSPGNDPLSAPFSRAADGSVSYQGDDEQRRLPVGPGYQVADGDPGSTVFMAPSSVFETVQGLVDALHTPASDPAARTAFHDVVSEFLTDVDQGMAHLGAVRAEIGGRLNAVESQKRANEDFALQLSEVISTVQDVDYAEAISRFNQQLTALQAAQQSFVRMQDLSLFKFL